MGDPSGEGFAFDNFLYMLQSAVTASHQPSLADTDVVLLSQQIRELLRAPGKPKLLG
jgi:hypothetical protein